MSTNIKTNTQRYSNMMIVNEVHMNTNINNELECLTKKQGFMY